MGESIVAQDAKGRSTAPRSVRGKTGSKEDMPKYAVESERLLRKLEGSFSSEGSVEEKKWVKVFRRRPVVTILSLTSLEVVGSEDEEEEENSTETDIAKYTLSMADIATNMIRQWCFMLFHNEEIGNDGILDPFRVLKMSWTINLDTEWFFWIADTNVDDRTTMDKRNPRPQPLHPGAPFIPAFIAKNQQGHFVPTPEYYKQSAWEQRGNPGDGKSVFLISPGRVERVLENVPRGLKHLHGEFRNIMTTMRNTAPTFKEMFDDSQIIAKSEKYFWEFFLKRIMDISWPSYSPSSSSNHDTTVDGEREVSTSRILFREKLRLENCPYLTAELNVPRETGGGRNTEKIAWCFADFFDGKMAEKIARYMMQNGSDEDEKEMDKMIGVVRHMPNYGYEDKKGIIPGRPKFYRFEALDYNGGFLFILKDIVYKFYEAVWLQRFLIAKENEETFKIFTDEET